MQKLLKISLLLFVINPCIAQSKKVNTNKDAIIKSVEKHQQELISISDKIWSYAETALKEHKSAKKLADYTSNINS